MFNGLTFFCAQSAKKKPYSNTTVAYDQGVCKIHETKTGGSTNLVTLSLYYQINCSSVNFKDCFEWNLLFVCTQHHI